jgi:hypothetical protein
MKISVNEPESKNVEAVYLNGKRLAMCVEADDQAGYVIVKLPPQQLAPDNLKQAERLLAVGDPIADDEWRTVRLTGEVEIIMATKNTDLGLER